MFIDFRDRERKGERKGERNSDVGETLIGCLLHVPRMGAETATQVCALTGN